MSDYTILVPEPFTPGSRIDISRHNPTASPWLSGLNIIEQANKWAEIQRTFQEVEAAMSLKGALDQVGSQLSPGQQVLLEFHRVENRYVIDKISTTLSGESTWKVAFGNEERSSGSVVLQGPAESECPLPGKERVTTGFVVADESGGNTRMWLDEKSGSKPEPAPNSAQSGIMLPIVEAGSVGKDSKEPTQPSGAREGANEPVRMPVGVP